MRGGPPAAIEGGDPMRGGAPAAIEGGEPMRGGAPVAIEGGEPIGGGAAVASATAVTGSGLLSGSRLLLSSLLRGISGHGALGGRMYFVRERYGDRIDYILDLDRAKCEYTSND